ncbi:MAG TPA: hypothetical protein VHG93_12655 [Longimicrobium sp.]|nr:hypothetical protein [Longimicrobium sp.]
MNKLRIPVLVRMAFATLAMLLAGCGDDGLTTPASITGTWLSVHERPEVEAATRVEDRLELTSDGRYVWTRVGFGARGRSRDGMVVWSSTSGDWGVQGERLSLRALVGMTWKHDGGWSQEASLDRFGGEHGLRLEGGQLVLTEIAPAERSSVQAYVFQRTTSPFDAP